MDFLATGNIQLALKISTAIANYAYYSNVFSIFT
jgi:hypothetical protein